MRKRQGFALMAALWLIVIIGATSYELSVRSRARRLAAANSLERIQGMAAAEGAIETVRAQLEERLARPLQVTVGTQVPDQWSGLRAFRPDTITIGDERAMAIVRDGGALLQINRASEDDLRRLLAAIPLDAGLADQLAQRIMDWRDGDDQRRARGAEREEYVRTGARRLPANADFTSVADLRDIEGMTPALFARIGPYITVRGTGQVNVNTAPGPVLYSLPGFGDEIVATILQNQRAGVPFRSLDDLNARLSSGARASLLGASSELATRITFETREILVEATGWLAHSPVRVREEAMFVRAGDAIFTQWRRTEP